MTVTNKRELALEYIRNTILPLIDGSGNYKNDIAKISRNFYVPDELRDDDFPMVCIVDDGETRYTPLTMDEYTTGISDQDIQDGIPVLLIGYVRRQDLGDKDDAGSLSTLMNNLSADIVVAMFRDTSLGDNILSVSLYSIAHSLLYMESNVGTVIHKYIIKYDFDPTGSNPEV